MKLIIYSNQFLIMCNIINIMTILIKINYKFKNLLDYIYDKIIYKYSNIKLSNFLNKSDIL